VAADDLNIRLVLQLVDRLTQPARAAVRSVEQIGAATERASGAAISWANQQLETTRARRQALQGEALGVAAMGFALTQALRPAIEFESAMAGVNKVIDFERPESIDALSRDIQELVTSGALPMAADGIAAIIEAAGQAGIVDASLPDEEQRAAFIEFARLAGTMGVAFGISADQSGEAMAQWRSRMGLTNEEAASLGDMINHLSNNMAASAPAVVDVIGRQGALARAAGLANHEIAALSAAFVASSPSSEIAATGMQNFLLTLASGEAMTDRQRAVLQELGLDATDLARAMQEDATGGIMSVLDALAQLPEHAQAAALTQLFGRESIGAITPLLTNLDLLRGSFALVADETAYAGSMQAEFLSQAGTTANQLAILRNWASRVAVSFGSVLLPQVVELVQAMAPMLAAVTDWIDANPEMISLIMRLAVGLLALRVASIALRWGFLSLYAPVLQVARALAWTIGLAPMLARGLLALLNPMGAVRAALWVLRAAFLASGVGLLLAGIAGAAVWIRNNWEGLQAFFAGFWDSFRTNMGAAAPVIQPIIDRARELWAWVTALLGPVDASAETWRGWGDACWRCASRWGLSACWRACSGSSRSARPSG